MSTFASKVDGMSVPQGANVDASDRERGPEPTTLSTASLLRQLMWKREGAALLLILVAELLAMTWYVIVNLLADSKTLYFEYTFAPRSTTAFIVWRVVALLSVSPPFVMGIKLVVDDVADSRKFQRKLALAGTIYVITLLAGNILGAFETSARTNYESEFAAKFNDFFCDTRTVRVCLEGSHDEMLVLTRGNATTIQATEDPTDVALSVWRRCQEVVHDRRKDATKSILTEQLSAFLNDCSGSHDADVWCGNALRHSTPLGSPFHLELPSPHALNPAMFARYKSEWAVRMQFSNGLLGGAAVCFLVSARISWY